MLSVDFFACTNKRSETKRAKDALHSSQSDGIAFYEQDLQTVKKMNAEYDEHLGNWGNFVKEFILGYERED